MEKSIESVLVKLGINPMNPGVSTGRNFYAGQGEVLSSVSPVDGTVIGTVGQASSEDYQLVMKTASDAFRIWSMVPAPERGQMIRQMGEHFRVNKQELGSLVSYEMGKSLQEGRGEVQEIIDICDFAVGLSRQLYGRTMASERPAHRMYEQWHPLGVVGIISAFNFPVAVWSWNAMLAWVCGNVCIWKPSEKAPLSALACQHIIQKVLQDNDIPEGVSNLIVGGPAIGQLLSADTRVALISATGSTRMGRAVAEAAARRLGRCLLELGGNNAVILTPSADLDVAIPGIVFGAVGTAGQRCTSTRRLIVQEQVYDEVKQRLIKAYAQLKIGNPLNTENHVGPLIDTEAVNLYQSAVEDIRAAGGRFIVEPGHPAGEIHGSGCYALPAIAEVENHFPVVQRETFAPILYLIRYRTIEEALAIQNGVPQGLSSSIFTSDVRESEYFLSSRGSDCGIANVNIGTSGAEIGGAFGGEKETGGGREAGSDAWKSYMRRQTNTINYGKALPLAQGIKFDV